MKTRRLLVITSLVLIALLIAPVVIFALSIKGAPSTTASGWNGMSSTEANLVAASDILVSSQGTPTSSGARVTAAIWRGCTPVNVAVYSSRVHVRCAETESGIQFFAASTNDADHVARILSLLMTALAAGKTLDILYEPSDTSGVNIGCEEQDCRLIEGVAFWR